MLDEHREPLHLRSPTRPGPAPPPLTPGPAEDPSRSAFSILPKLPLELEGLVPSSSTGAADHIPVAMRTDDQRRALMLEQARELAARGHQAGMIEAVLKANGFPEATEWIYRPHVHKELKDIADTARKQAVRLSTEPAD